MDKEFLKQNFKYIIDLDQDHKESKEKSIEGWARVQFMDNGNRVGKFYWDRIEILYDNSEKPFIIIITLQGVNITIY